MRHNKLAVLLFVIAMVAALAGCGPTVAQYPAPKGHVNDFAEVLEDKAEKDMESYLVNFKKKTGIEVAVMTTPSLYGLTIEQYSIKLAEKWGTGGKKQDTGVIFVVAPRDKKLRIEVGYGLEDRLTDLKCKEMVEKVILPHIKQTKRPGEAQFTAATLAAVNGILVALGHESTPFAQQTPTGLPLWAIIVLVIIVLILKIFVASNGGGGGGWSSGGGYRSSGGSSFSFGGGRFGGGGASGSW